MPGDCRPLKLAAYMVLCLLAQVSLFARPAGADPLASALAVLDSRLARIEEAIFPESPGPVPLIAPTGRISQAALVITGIHARLARLEVALAGKALPAPQTIAPTGAASRRAIDHRLASLDARVARIEQMIVGSRLPSPCAVSYTGVVYRSNTHRNVASLSTRLQRIEAATRPHPDKPAQPAEEASPVEMTEPE